MAGKAAKKAAKAGESTANLYFPVIVGVNVLYVLFKVFYNFRSFSRWQALGLLSTSLTYYVCYNGLVEAARMGIPGGVYFDILVVTLTGQAVSTFSSYGWYIYLLIPLYYASVASYWVLRKLGGWMTSQNLDNASSEEESVRELKRQAKKERKAARGPKMRVR